MRKVFEHVGELYRYRALIESLVWRDVKGRYRGSVFGYLWTLLNPLFLLIVYRTVFTKMTRAVDMPNYAVFFFVGILPWLWHSSTLNTGVVSIVTNAGLVTRVCMPPHLLPAVGVISNLVNLLLALPVALVAAAWYGCWPTTALVALPLVIAVHFVFLYGLSLLLATLTVSFRDIQFIVQNLMLVWFLGTPIAYPLSGVEGLYRTVLLWNPATSLIVPYQEILYEGRLPGAGHLATGAAWAALALWVGVHVYESRRGSLAEEV